jgi:hypothetical protein
MQLFVIFGALVLVSGFARANAGVDERSVLQKLNAKRILETTPAQSVGSHLLTPTAFRYVRNGDEAPSCGLLLNDGQYIDLVSPEPGGRLPACAAPLNKPTYFNFKGAYIVYEYKVEDPKATVTKAFQLYRLTDSRVDVCRNDAQLTALALSGVKSKSVGASFKGAIVKLGCQ